MVNHLVPLIQRISSNENQTSDNDELQIFKVVFETFAKMVDNTPNNKHKMKATKLIQRGIQIIEEAIMNEMSGIKRQLETLAIEIQPLMIAEQLSNKKIEHQSLC